MFYIEIENGDLDNSVINYLKEEYNIISEYKNNSDIIILKSNNKNNIENYMNDYNEKYKIREI